ncbi:MAG: hypothetical protein J5I92_14520 [Thiogranum sp.]|nr:hypothetical protein [Thiogranum sp.]
MNRDHGALLFKVVVGQRHNPQQQTVSNLTWMIADCANALLSNAAGEMARKLNNAATQSITTISTQFGCYQGTTNAGASLQALMVRNKRFTEYSRYLQVGDSGFAAVAGHGFGESGGRFVSDRCAGTRARV